MKRIKAIWHGLDRFDTAIWCFLVSMAMLDQITGWRAVLFGWVFLGMALVTAGLELTKMYYERRREKAWCANNRLYDTLVGLEPALAVLDDPEARSAWEKIHGPGSAGPTISLKEAAEQFKTVFDEARYAAEGRSE